MRANKGQAIFGWIAGALCMVGGLSQLGEYDGQPVIPFVIGLLLIMYALSYQRPEKL